MSEPIFDRGDVISNLLKTDIRVITGYSDGCYEYINLKKQQLKDVLGVIHTIEKGSVSTQPIDIVHKHFSILEL